MKSYMHLSQLFSLCPKLLSKTTSFLVVSASLVHPTCLWGPEGAERASSQQNKPHQTSTSSEMYREAGLVQLKAKKVPCQPAVTSS